MKRALAILAIAAIAMPAMAGLVTTTATPYNGGVSYFGDQSAGTTIPVYDNTVNESGYYYNTAGLEEGDDLMMTAGGQIDHFAFGYYDPSGDGAVTTAADVRFYDMATFVGDGTDVPLAAYSVTNLPGEGGWIVDVDLDTPSPVMPADIVMSVQFDNTVDAGLLIYDPPVIGSSADMFWLNDGSGNWYYFGGNPVANFALEVEMVPEPASLALLALGGLALLRRR